jgi:hypothetical protein
MRLQHNQLPPKNLPLTLTKVTGYMVLRLVGKTSVNA